MSAGSGPATAEFPAEPFAAVTQWPPRCAPHGRPPVDQVRAPIVSWPRRQAHKHAALGALGAVFAVLETLSQQRRVWVDNWPMCSRCHRRRQRLRWTTRLMAWGGLAGFVGGLVAGIVIRNVTGDYASPWLIVPILAGLATLLASAIPLTYAQPSRIARTWVTPDGERVRLIRPDPEFAREVRRLTGG